MWTMVVILVVGIAMIWKEGEELKKPVYLEAYLRHLEQKFQREVVLKERRMKPQYVGGVRKLDVGKSNWVREPNRVKALGMLDINTADSVAWVALPGIGPSFAHRIVAFREKLGGFYTVEQLAEVYGLDSAWVKKNQGYLKLGNGIFRKLKVNQLDWKSLKHPYLSYHQAKIFFRYRQQHGSVKNWEQLKEIILLDEKLWVKLRPYLDFE